MPSALKGRKNFFILLLAVVAFMLFMLWVINEQVVGNLQLNAMKSNALSVYLSAKQVLADNNGEALSDADIARGLAGTVNGTSNPGAERLSRRMNELLAPDIVLSEEPEDGKVKASFVVKNGQIISLRYEALTGKRRYAVMLDDGGIVTVEQVKEAKQE